MTEWIGPVADLSSIITAVVAVTFYVQHRRDLSKKVRSLEEFLKADTLHVHNLNPGRRNAVFLMATLGLTEDEIFQASCRSRHIHRIPIWGPSHRAEDIFFEYVEDLSQFRPASPLPGTPAVPAQAAPAPNQPPSPAAPAN